MSATFEFYVSAGEKDVFEWLRDRAKKAERLAPAAVDDARVINVRWSPGTSDGPEDAVDMALNVTAVRSGLSRVTVVVEGESARPREAIEDFAGPLGPRMTGLRVRSREFFDPPRSFGDNVVLVAWAACLVVALVVVVATRHIPAAHEKFSAREAFAEFFVALVLTGFAAGVVAGIAVYRPSRWFELPLLCTVIAGGCTVSVVVCWNVWADTGPAGSSGATFLLTVGPAIFAVTEALAVLVGIGVIRTPFARTAWRAMRVRNRILREPR